METPSNTASGSLSNALQWHQTHMSCIFLPHVWPWCPGALSNSNVRSPMVSVPVTAFNGQLGDGEWTLTVTDAATWDTGVLNSWSIDIN